MYKNRARGTHVHMRNITMAMVHMQCLYVSGPVHGLCRPTNLVTLKSSYTYIGNICSGGALDKWGGCDEKETQHKQPHIFRIGKLTNGTHYLSNFLSSYGCRYNEYLRFWELGRCCIYDSFLVNDFRGVGYI